MAMTKRLLPLLLLGWMVSGCSTTITNLTPGQLARNSSGLYRFEVAWQSRQHNIARETISPQVVIGLDTYPMQPTAVVSNHWEAMIPVPASKDLLNYHFKFDYQYKAIPVRRPNSKLSRNYQLQITAP